jgi:hypothetical protein
LINARVPLCLLDTRDGGDAQSGALAPATRKESSEKRTIAFNVSGIEADSDDATLIERIELAAA